MKRSSYSAAVLMLLCALSTSFIISIQAQQSTACQGLKAQCEAGCPPGATPEFQCQDNTNGGSPSHSCSCSSNSGSTTSTGAGASNLNGYQQQSQPGSSSTQTSQTTTTNLNAPQLLTCDQERANCETLCRSTSDKIDFQCTPDANGNAASKSCACKATTITAPTNSTASPSPSPKPTPTSSPSPAPSPSTSSETTGTNGGSSSSSQQSSPSRNGTTIDMGSSATRTDGMPMASSAVKRFTKVAVVMAAVTMVFAV